LLGSHTLTIPKMKILSHKQSTKSSIKLLYRDFRSGIRYVVDNLHIIEYFVKNRLFPKSLKWEIKEISYKRVFWINIQCFAYTIVFIQIYDPPFHFLFISFYFILKIDKFFKINKIVEMRNNLIPVSVPILLIKLITIWAKARVND
jgi:hypothetical protein